MQSEPIRRHLASSLPRPDAGYATLLERMDAIEARLAALEAPAVIIDTQAAMEAFKATLVDETVRSFVASHLAVTGNASDRISCAELHAAYHAATASGVSPRRFVRMIGQLLTIDISSFERVAVGVRLRDRSSEPSERTRCVEAGLFAPVFLDGRDAAKFILSSSDHRAHVDAAAARPAGDSETECAADIPPLPGQPDWTVEAMAEVIAECINTYGCVTLEDFRRAGFEPADVLRLGHRARDAAILSGRMRKPVMIEWPMGPFA